MPPLAALPVRFRPLEPAAADVRAALHIRDLVFDEIDEPQIDFADDGSELNA